MLVLFLISSQCFDDLGTSDTHSLFNQTIPESCPVNGAKDSSDIQEYDCRRRSSCLTVGENLLNASAVESKTTHNCCLRGVGNPWRIT